MTPAHFDELRALRGARASRGRTATSCWWRSGDEVLDYREAVAFYGGAWQYVRGGGDHAFVDFVPQIPAILRFAGVGGRRLTAALSTSR